MRMINCPVCLKKVDIALINRHLDTCTEQSESAPPPSAPAAPTETAPEPTSQPAKSVSSLLTGTKSAKKSSYKYGNREKRTFSDSQSLSSDQEVNTSIEIVDPEPKARKTAPADELRLLKAQAKLPLAERLRPSSLEDYVGQEHLVGEGGILRGFIQNDRVPSLILWGSPGTGKTTLARIISHATKSRFIELSATSNGINDCKRVFEEARNEDKLTKRHTIVFIDEIHRFNKAQQDIFLPHVEKGTITLVGATTENPSFQLNSALLSRCKVFVLNKLTSDELHRIVSKALLVTNKTRKLVHNVPILRFNKEAIGYICNIADGDSRSALNLLELADSHFMTNYSLEPGKHVIEVDAEQLRDVLKRTHMVYDRVGDAHYDTISAFHKSVRGSNADAAMYYLGRMLKGGENPLFIARRMIRIASEDVGVLDDTCLPFAIATYQAVQFVGLPEADLALAHCAVKLARAPKSVEIYRAWNELNARLDSEPEFASASIPLHLRNAPTKLMKEIGYSKGYKYNPDYKDGRVKQEYFPEQIGEMQFLTGQHLGLTPDPDL
ncbi:hypothetical protein KL930_004496 [Ogataea haglerorum]|uniref:UBZ4-type domain-containing protein n=1 Tax=Ogataea haglerorum TaxID=1937702 RepID=A0AAN6D2C8_9ASCO|nr:uncharacterized protein KL911_004850 [Ogataea haglerorum]KAG7692520.1 hypothetical protein KL915_004567 [Ogataea haglerorum]KAG7692755.1 hypothetical protein KL951_004766 [Ogataea haglerorum]KAG7703467.1 hypothetical protein KL950_004695 [Ogataea haglerorum]KAG7703968.1 hypothetical protein KL914_004459 [Ogataea haglerorum]KAG7715588.1 hypothetical protein KL913_003923 [Ogataea haglerorum]